MIAKYVFNFLLLSLLIFSQHTFAQESQEPKSRDVLVKESIANLYSTDIHVVEQAAIYLGIFQAKESVPALIRVLKSSRLLSQTEHRNLGERRREWVLTDVKSAIINALGRIGDKRAVPVLKKYLMKPPKNSAVYTKNVAYALYQITGKSYKYKDRDGKVKLFQNNEN